MRDARLARRAALVALALAGPAAADNPTSTTPEPAAPPAPSATIASAETPSGPLSRITLAQALQRALAQNVSIVVAVEEIQRAEARLRQARAASLPSLTGNGVYTHIDAARRASLAGGAVVTFAAQEQLAANLALTVPLVVPQRWAQWSHASTDVKTSRAAAEDVRRQTAVTVARAFLTVISQKHVVDVNEHALKTAKAHYDYAHTRLLGGVGNRVDEVRAEQQMVTTQAQIENSYTALARAREALGILLGDQGPIDAIEDFPLPSAPGFATALEEAATKRPDVVAGRQRFDAAEQTRKDSYTDYLPFLIGVFQPFYQSPATLTQPKTGWQAQLLLTIPFYDGGLRYGLGAERESVSAEARAQYEGMVRQARSDVRVAFEAVKRAEAALASAVDSARLAKTALELATIAYRAGATTNLEVIDAERASHQADTAAAVAEDQAGQARIELLAASGRFP
jgi:outer membrane protein TolC